MIKIAITGNIASGKSQVEKILKKLGYKVYDSDEIAHSILDTITDFYGLDVFTDGKIDRKKLGNLVFSNPQIKQNLEKLIHPKVKNKILEIFAKHSEDNCIFISVPLLYETGFDNLFDKVILITVDEQEQLKRLMTRNNLSKEEAKKRINSQIKQSEKVQKADFVIHNVSTFIDLEAKTISVLKEIFK